MNNSNEPSILVALPRSYYDNNRELIGHQLLDITLECCSDSGDSIPITFVSDTDKPNTILKHYEEELQERNTQLVIFYHEDNWFNGKFVISEFFKHQMYYVLAAIKLNIKVALAYIHENQQLSLYAVSFKNIPEFTNKVNNWDYTHVIENFDINFEGIPGTGSDVLNYIKKEFSTSDKPIQEQQKVDRKERENLISFKSFPIYTYKNSTKSGDIDEPLIFLLQ